MDAEAQRVGAEVGAAAGKGMGEGVVVFQRERLGIDQTSTRTPVSRTVRAILLSCCCRRAGANRPTQRARVAAND